MQWMTTIIMQKQKIVLHRNLSQFSVRTMNEQQNKNLASWRCLHVRASMEMLARKNLRGTFAWIRKSHA